MNRAKLVAMQSADLRKMAQEINEKKAKGINTVMEEQRFMALANVYLVNAGAQGNAAHLRREIGDERFFEVEAW